MYSRNKIISVDVSERIDLRSRAGESFNLQIVLTNTDGSAFDLSSYTLTFEVLDSANTVVLSAATGTGLAISGNEIAIDKSAADMSALAANNYSYRLKAVNGTYEKTWVDGQFMLYAGITPPVTTYDTLQKPVYIQGSEVNFVISNN